MKKWQKILACLCVGTLALSAFGCGGQKGEKKTADGGQKVKIEYWHVAAESLGGATVKELVKEELKEHGITHSTIEVEKVGEKCLAEKCVVDTKSIGTHSHHHH